MPSDKATFVRRVNQLLSASREVAALADMLEEEVEHFAEYLGDEFDRSPRILASSSRTVDAEALAEDRSVLVDDASSALLSISPIRGELIKVMSDMAATSKQNILRAMQDRLKR